MSISRKNQFNFLKNELRYRIWGLLSMYSELSFTELCKKLYKSKSTVHPHLRELIRNGIVKVVREVKVRGNIPAKIFALTNRELNKSFFTGIKDMENFSNINSKNSKTIISNAKSFEVHSRNFANLKLKFYESLEESADAADVLKQMKEEEELSSIVMFLTETQYRDFRILFSDLLKRMNKLIEKDEDKQKKEESPFLFMASSINMNRILKRVFTSQERNQKKKGLNNK